MALKSESDWKSEYAKLELVSDQKENGVFVWITNLANYIEDMVKDMTLKSYSPPPTFTFNKTTFISTLGATTVIPPNGVATLSSAFNLALGASTMLLTFPCDTTGTSSPATTFSVGVTTVLPTSLTQGAQAILGLAEIPEEEFTSKAEDSKFPIILREAFAGLQYTTIGSNSVTPTVQPFTDVAEVE